MAAVFCPGGFGGGACCPHAIWPQIDARNIDVMMCRRIALTSLETVGDQDTPFGAHGGFSILALDASS
jgi:hypothetical protein